MNEDAPSNLAIYYRELALNAFAAAKLIKSQRDRMVMQRIALGYEDLACSAEQRAQTAARMASVMAPKQEPAKT
jgi:hypothetical protein